MPHRLQWFLDWSLFQRRGIASVLAAHETYGSASKHRAVPNGMGPPEHTRYSVEEHS